MADDPKTWLVLPHDPMEQLADNLWRVEGEVPNMQLRRVMTVVRLASGDLVLHSAIAMDDAGMEALEELGRPAFLVVPNGWHRLDAARYKARYPDLKVVCPAGARRSVGKVVPVDHDYGDLPQPEADDDTVRFAHFGERKQAEGAMLVRSPDGVSVVFADTLFNLPHQPGCVWFFYGRVMGSSGGPKVTLIGRLMLLFTRTGKQTRAWMERTAETEPVVRLIPGHGQVVTQDAAATLKTVASRL